LRLYFNFFQPVLKLISKQNVVNRVINRCDKASTPYQRILASKYIPLEIKACSTHLYVQLNPVQLRNMIDAKVAKL